MENWLAALPKLELDVKLEDTRLGGRDVLLDGIESMSDPQVLNRQLMRDADYYQLRITGCCAAMLKGWFMSSRALCPLPIQHSLLPRLWKR